MVDISGFLTFMKDYSKENDREIEISFNTNWNEDKGIYIEIYNFDDDDDENYLIDCKITKNSYRFSNIAYWNADILEQILSCMKYENRGMLPSNVYINGFDFDYSSFESVKELLDCYKCSNRNSNYEIEDEDEEDYDDDE